MCNTIVFDIDVSIIPVCYITCIAISAHRIAITQPYPHTVVQPHTWHYPHTGFGAVYAIETRCVDRVVYAIATPCAEMAVYAIARRCADNAMYVAARRCADMDV